MPDPGTASVGGSIIGGIGQGRAARRAARAQERAAAEDLAFQRETRDTVRNDFAPYREGGGNAFDAYLFEMGLGNRPMIGGDAPQIETITGGMPQTGGQFPLQAPGGGPLSPAAAPALTTGQRAGRWMDSFGRADRDGTGTSNGSGGAGSIDSRPPVQPTAGAAGPSQMFRVNGRDFATMEDAQAYANANRTGGQAYGGFQKSQDYLFGLREGTNAVEASAAARGGLFSGAAMRDLNTFAQDYGSQRRGEYLNRLAGIADAGQAAAGASGNASMSAAGNVSNALAARGNATAAGAIGVGNAINSGIGNALGAWNYQQQLRAGGSGANTYAGTGSYGGGR